MQPHFLLDLEIQDLHTVDHASLARSIFEGISLAPPPFRIALFGPWGSGKSTILKMVQELIDDTNAAAEGSEEGLYVKPIWFNAWEYESHPNLLMSLLTLLTAEIPDGVRYSRKGSKAIRQAALSTEYLGLRWSRRSASHEGDGHARHLSERVDGEHQDVNHVDIMKDAFRKLVDYSLVQGPRNATRRLVVFIDDLDKCQPATVLAFLESIKLFLDRGTPMVIVFALDREVVRNAIGQKYAQRSFDSDRYLEKIFEFNYDVPPIAIRHIKPLIGELYERAGLARFAPSSHATVTELEIIERVLSHPGLHLSPRKIKRIFNKFVWFLAARGRLPVHPPRPGQENPQTSLPGTAEEAPPVPEDDMPPLEYWLTWLLTGEYFKSFRSLVVTHGEPALAELCNRVTGNPIIPHANSNVRQHFDALDNLNGLFEYYRSVFDATGAAHIPQVQTRMKERVAEFARIDRLLQLNGV